LLGEIPGHWEVHRLKHIASIFYSNVDKNSSEGEQPVRLCNYIDVYNNEYIFSELDLMEATASSAEIAKFELKKGDVLITKDSEDWRDIAVSAYVVSDMDNVLCGYHLAQITPDVGILEGKYLFRAFSARGLNDQFRIAATGITRYGLGKYWLDNSFFPVPPVDEQRAISTFLDRETKRIDTLITKKERQIELLQEKRAALISHVVTKGLNPNVKMKDSGIEWLGEIPEHWVTYPIKRMSIRIQTGCTPPTSEERYYENGTVPWYGPGSFGTNLVLSEPVKLLNEAAIREGTARLFAPDSIMVVCIGATIGKVGYLENPASSNQQITAITPNPMKASGRFLSYQLKRLEHVLRGIAPSTTLPIMDQQEVGYLPCALPSLGEQHLIAEYLNRSLQKTDAMTTKIHDSIAMLREYRTALISAAVTGKIDVRKEVV
jgi:type I restriction enzyme S subunit